MLGLGLHAEVVLVVVRHQIGVDELRAQKELAQRQRLISFVVKPEMSVERGSDLVLIFWRRYIYISFSQFSKRIYSELIKLKS